MIDKTAALGDQLVVEVMVRDLERSLAFYLGLGFLLERREGDFAALRWEGREFFLDQRADLPLSNGASRANVRILTDDVDAIWTAVQKLGAPVERTIGDREYGLRDFTVLDPDGFGVRFAGPLSGD